LAARHYGLRKRNSNPAGGASASHRKTVCRAFEIKKEYLKKARSLDGRFEGFQSVPDEDAGVYRWSVGPFELAYESFAVKGVLPCVAGAFCEANCGFETLVSTLALLAAKRKEGFGSPVPLDVDARSRYVFIVFRVSAFSWGYYCRANLALKLQRLPFIRRTKATARNRPEAWVCSFVRRSTSDPDDWPLFVRATQAGELRPTAVLALLSMISLTSLGIDSDCEEKCSRNYSYKYNIVIDVTRLVFHRADEH
jgi:hypothetical protein